MSAQSYRPVTDVMILARSKVKYYGAYPAGFLHRARVMLGVTPTQPVLHVCGGKVREYPFRGFGPNDKTVDVDPACEPDFLMDVRVELPKNPGVQSGLWAGVLIDRPYTVEDAEHYVPGGNALPNINQLLRDCLMLVPKGHRVGVLDYVWPHPGAHGQEVAVMAVGTGRNSRARWYTVFERMTT